MTVIEGVKPTRMELIVTRKRRALAEKGHELLSEKRDALIVQFFDLVERRGSMRNDLISEMEGVYGNVTTARMTTGDSKLRGLLHSMPDRHELDVRATSVMGIRIPQVVQREIGKRVNFT